MFSPKKLKLQYMVWNKYSIWRQNFIFWWSIPLNFSASELSVKTNSSNKHRQDKERKYVWEALSSSSEMSPNQSIFAFVIAERLMFPPQRKCENRCTHWLFSALPGVSVGILWQFGFLLQGFWNIRRALLIREMISGIRTSITCDFHKRLTWLHSF